MTFRLHVFYLLALLVLFALWRSEVTETRQMRLALVEAVKENSRLCESLRLSERYGMAQHEELKNSIKEE